ncbi:MAG: hypothetical protein IT458_12850 [Planctomycetes bacterium]|nr:hypothetical protein [Planctomycetota bacterium]
MRISTAATPAVTATTTFDTNHGADKATVVPASSVFNFGVYPPVTPGPTPFVFKVPFTTPFAFAGAGGIAWEMLIASRTNTTAFSLDAASGVFNLVGVSFGTGCLASGKTSAASVSSSYSTTTGNLTLNAANFANSAPGALVLGINNQVWNGLPLPFDIPGTTGGSSGTCRVYADYLFDIPLMASATGAMSIATPVAINPSTLGVFFYHWAFGLDAAANSLGVISSNARYTGLGDGTTIGGCRVYAFNNVAATTGSRDSTTLITEFTY